MDPVKIMEAISHSTLEVTRPDHEIVAEIAGRLLGGAFSDPQFEGFHVVGVDPTCDSDAVHCVKKARAILAEARRQCAGEAKEGGAQ